MKMIQSDVISAEALAPKLTSAKEAPPKAASQNQPNKPAGFHAILAKFGKHPADMAKETVNANARAGDASKAAIASGVADQGLSAEAESDGKDADVSTMMDPTSPALWAQMQMAQGVPVDPSGVGSAVVNSFGTTGSALAAEQAKASASGDAVLTNALASAAVNSGTSHVAASVAQANPTLNQRRGATELEALSQVASPEQTKLDAGSGLAGSPKSHVSHVGGGKTTSWVAELGQLASAANAQRQTSEPGSPTADKLPVHVAPTDIQASMPMFAMTDGLPQEHRLSALSGKAGFESDQGLYSNQGLDMTSQANQTAANLGISASIPIDAAPETAVATQVAVWVSQNIQSAELKLDAQGSDPVEVSISMVGNQATVEFRCDTAETRDMLNRAADQLDTMLKSEGLILSGVSVGTSSQQQARDRSSEPSQSGIQRMGRGLASRSAGAPDQTIHVVQRSRVVDGAVDLFV